MMLAVSSGGPWGWVCHPARAAVLVMMAGGRREHEPGGQGVGVHQGRLYFRVV